MVSPAGVDVYDFIRTVWGLGLRVGVLEGLGFRQLCLWPVSLPRIGAAGFVATSYLAKKDWFLKEGFWNAI